MGQVAAEWMQRVHQTNPYQDFPFQEYPFDPIGGGQHPMFERIIKNLRPQRIIEVGTWRGASALHMASLYRQLEIDGVIVCVDTWLGGLEHWEHREHPVWGIGKYCRHGYPSLYQQFLANVMHAGLEEYIVPVPNSSVIAGRWLAKMDFVADAVYIDASHEEDDVYQDLIRYWELVRSQGILFGDDWHVQWYGVICAVNRFAREHRVDVKVDGEKWAIRKP